MINFLNNTRDRLKSWITRHARGRRAVWWLAGASFAESSFSPLPPDVVLAAMLASGSGRWLYYSAITALTSVAGGVFGYMIGLWFFDLFGQSLVALYGLESELGVVREKFANNAFVAIFLAAFTPIPYKVFTIAAGLFKIDFLIFVIASAAGRSLRFLLLGSIMGKFGPRMGMLMFRYFNAAVLAAVIIGLIALILIVVL
jgi:membrane protein YqaA with SNARE-associated domain